MTNFATIQYKKTGQSQNTDTLGMREMQARAYAKRFSQYLLIKAPPASGKSRALMFLALDKIYNQSLKKAIITVPERSIGASFASAPLSQQGFFRDWELPDHWDLTKSGNPKKVDSFCRFMASDDPVLLCTHSTLRFAFEKLGVEAFDNILIAIDEFHHVSSNDDSRLGDIVHKLIDRDKAHLVAMTGSYFRGDTLSVLKPEDENKFTPVTYTYYEQLNGYNYLKTLGIGYHFYNGSYLDSIGAVLNPNLKTIIHIPHTNSTAADGNKYNAVSRLIDSLGVYLETDKETGLYHVKIPSGRILKIADLVDDSPDANREKVLATLRAIKNREDVDIIIAMGMAKEGFDWIWCEHALTIGYRGSLTEIIQIIGRTTRDAQGKTHAQFTNLIAEPLESHTKVQEAVNNMLKAIACSLLMEQVLAPNYKFHSRKEDDRIDGSSRAVLDDGTIRIKGLVEPSSDQVKRICDSDLGDLVATVLQDERVIKTGLNENMPAEIFSQNLLPDIIRKQYPQLDNDQVDEVRQHLAAKLAFSSPAIELDPKFTDQEQQKIQRDHLEDQVALAAGINPFIRMADKLVHVNDLHINLIDQINPFQSSYKIMSKTLTSEGLKAIHEVLHQNNTTISMTEDEACAWWPKIRAFFEERKQEPQITSDHPVEQRMAEALIWIKKKKAETQGHGSISEKA